MSATVLGVGILPGQCNNLAELENLNEDTLLEELRVRYMADNIYTYVGEILVAVNPYKTIPGIYDDSQVKKYRHGVDKKSVPPHIFATADNAFQALKTNLKNQVCVISGESGAGKTESAKLFLKQVIELSKGTESAGLEEKIINCNPLLEAFGNAQTLMNDNSSRFGKYLDLKFNAALGVKGAVITQYLLEKSRVVFQADGEQNFHIFYYFFSSLDASTKEQFQVGDPSDFPYVNGNPKALQFITTPQCKSLWEEVKQCMDDIGFSNEERDNLFALLAGILHFGCLEFKGEEEASLSSATEVLHSACNQLGCLPDQIELALTTLVTITRGEEVVRNYRVEQARDCTDATAKALYEKAFRWIVTRINTLLTPADVKHASSDLAISFLDIFGFENFDDNSFEQLCINLANEQLQFFFNNHIFAMELAEYAREGIDGSNIKYTSNQACLDMMLQKKPPGLLSICDEECSFPKASDATMVEKFHNAYGKHPDYVKPRGNDPVFTVKHYAGDVCYQAEGFLEKNRDTLPADVQAALRLSTNTLVRQIFNSDDDDAKTAKAGRKGRGFASKRDLRASRKRLRQSMKKVHQSLARKKKVTVGSEFKISLDNLMTNLNASAPHFIRCIKPNQNKKPQDYDGDMVKKQLRYTGMLETTRIRREGYSVRPSFQDFIDRYKPIGFYFSEKPPGTAPSAERILKKAGIDGWLLGKTKVFLKYYHVDMLGDLLKPIDNAAAQLQKVFRGGVARRSYGAMKAVAEREAKSVQNLISSVERNGSNTHDVVQALCEEDAKRPKDALAGGGPPLADRAYKKRSSKGKGKGMKRAASVKWFKEVEMAKGSAMPDQEHGTGMGGFAQWFHGILSRAESEAMLNREKTGTFLIRVSESRFGYSLSVRHDQRVKHFMIDQTPEGRYMVVGNERTFQSLNALVSFHKNHSLTDDGDVLSYPCPQDANNLADFM